MGLSMTKLAAIIITHLKRAKDRVTRVDLRILYELDPERGRSFRRVTKPNSAVFSDHRGQNGTGVSKLSFKTTTIT